MSVRIAINGLGRIGRCVIRALQKHSSIELVAVNDIADINLLAYLLKYDSVHGPFRGSIDINKDQLLIDNKSIKVFSCKNISEINWTDLNVDFVLESTGIFLTKEKAGEHLKQGAKKVVLSAPPKENDIPVFVYGVNQDSYNPNTDHIVSNASCTTNCLAPIAKILDDQFGIEEALMTTVHAVTVKQPVVDAPLMKDYRGGRSALLNLIPSSTGAAKAVGKCLPNLQGKLTGMAFRVPVADVSAVDLTVRLTKSTDYDTICETMKEASNSHLKGILGYTEDPVVSSDFIGSSFSCIFDKHAGIGLNEHFFKIIAWYDNEMGYAYRMVDLMRYMATQK